MSERIDIKSARAMLGRLVDRAAGGEQIELTKYGKVVALLVPPVPILPPEADAVQVSKTRPQLGGSELAREQQRQRDELLSGFGKKK